MFDQIHTCTSMSAYVRSSCQVWSNHLYTYDCPRALVEMEWYIRFLPIVNKINFTSTYA